MARCHRRRLPNDGDPLLHHRAPAPKPAQPHQWLNHWLNIGNDGLTALHRSWAIETGIIEIICRLDEAQTETLIDRGFEPAVTLRNVGTAAAPAATNKPPKSERYLAEQQELYPYGETGSLAGRATIPFGEIG